VRGNSNYGQNSFVGNGNGTISDNATGLVWLQADSGVGMNWADALTYCEDLSAAGFDDWRLPNAKELQSIVDYSRSPDTTNSAAIDPGFNVTAITNEAGQTDYPFYWSSTTHADSSGRGSSAAYVSFGRALGYMNSWMDVHGAGAQRSDPKTGSASEFPQGHGPQGDAVRVDNYVRCVRSGDMTYVSGNTTVTNRPGVSVEGASINNAGQQGQGQPTMDAQQGPGGANGGQGPDIAAAAATLGVTEDAIRAALGPPGQGRPDFASAAQTLGVTEAELMSALGIAGGGPPPISTP